MLVFVFPQDGSCGGWRSSFLRLWQTMSLDLGDLRLEINKHQTGEGTRFKIFTKHCVSSIYDGFCRRASEGEVC